MSKGTNIQDSFLNNARTGQVPVTVFLTNGFQQKGTIISYDGYTVMLMNEGKQHLIYKHAISTIVPVRCIEYYNKGEE